MLLLKHDVPYFLTFSLLLSFVVGRNLNQRDVKSVDIQLLKLMERLKIIEKHDEQQNDRFKKQQMDIDNLMTELLAYQQKSGKLDTGLASSNSVANDIIETPRPNRNSLDYVENTKYAIGDRSERQDTRANQRTKRAGSQVQSIAFFATTTQYSIDQSYGLNVMFDSVITNFGSGFDYNTASFTAPVPGTYVFSVRISRISSSDDETFKLTRNGNSVNQFRMHGTGLGVNGEMAVLQLKQGDYVAVQHAYSSGSRHSHTDSSFSGFLLSHEDQAPSAVGK